LESAPAMELESVLEAGAAVRQDQDNPHQWE
jgi:hypothetical protein